MKNQRFSILIKSLFVCIVLFLGWPHLLTGGSLDPVAPPGSTMNSLEDIYNAIQSVQLTIDSLPDQGGSDLAGKEGFTQQFTFTSYDNIAKSFQVLTVPTGKNLVVMQVYIKGYMAQLDVWQGGGFSKTLIDWDFLEYSETVAARKVFPEPCMTIYGGEALYVKIQPKSLPESPYWKSTVKFALVGYYVNVSP
jgi:hypothetical protein